MQQEVMDAILVRQRGQWVELEVGGGYQLGRLQAWGIDRRGPWVLLSGEEFDWGDIRGPWTGADSTAEP